MKSKLRYLKGILIDLDGVLWIAGSPAKYSANFLFNIRKYSIPFNILTNDCSVSKDYRINMLFKNRLMIKENELVMAAEITNHWLKNRNINKIMYLGAPNVLPDVSKGLDVFENGNVDAVVVGDVFDSYNRHIINKAAIAIKAGALFIAIQSNPLWSDGKNYYVDNGFWIAGLEYVTGTKAIVTGKPNKYAYLFALHNLGFDSQDIPNVAFISDDLKVDLKGAKNVGFQTIYIGNINKLPPWVDYSANDLNTLIHLII